MGNELLKLLFENPEMAVTTAKAMVMKYKPTVYALLGILLDMYKDYANNDELFKTEAKVHKQALDAMLAEGFTREEALSLMINQNLNLAKATAQLNAANANLASATK